MRTVAVTFGDGAFRRIAAAMAKRFTALNEIEVILLDIDKLPPMDHAGWAKTCMWDQLPADVDRAIWFDADMIPIAPITDLIPHPDVLFAAVPDMYHGGRQEAEWDIEDVIDLPTYYNSGLFVANRVTAPAFAAARARMNERTWSHWDQTPLNLELHKILGEADVEALPRIANWMPGFSNQAPQDMRMLHLAGFPNGGLRFCLLNAFIIAFERLTAEELAEKGAALCCASCAS